VILEESIDVSVVIPAFKPNHNLPVLIQRLSAGGVAAIVVVDDGSGADYESCFTAIQQIPNVHVLRHALNLGKGAALKTGINYVLCTFPGQAGIVTADADGQHAAEDVLMIGCLLQKDDPALILGVRQFDSGTPLRSRFGNQVTRSVLRAVVGQKLADTQTGLRGIPRAVAAELLRIPSNGYEFELDALIACKHKSVPIREEPIETIYLDGNRSSHFNPVIDSMKIYFVLLRFALVSLATAVLDNAVFFGAFRITAVIWKSQVAGRAAALIFNYIGGRRAVFLSREPHAVTLPKYLLQVGFNGILSYGLMSLLMSRAGLPLTWAKILAETALFLPNFAIQRDFVFRRRGDAPAATDWTRYYASVPFTAKLTRRYTSRVLVGAIQKFAGAKQKIVEIGGANSCFLDPILAGTNPASYHVIDNNQYGLDLLKQRAAERVSASKMDVLQIEPSPDADLVFSIGLIEHFAPEDTARAVRAHFDLLRSGGVAMISFPTPTWLYRGARAVCEAAGIWKFPDERPLGRAEVLKTAAQFGDVLFEKTLWPLVFTQRLIVLRKR
jgi:putative flippase GtrA